MAVRFGSIPKHSEYLTCRPIFNTQAYDVPVSRLYFRLQMTGCYYNNMLSKLLTLFYIGEFVTLPGIDTRVHTVLNTYNI